MLLMLQAFEDMIVDEDWESIMARDGLKLSLVPIFPSRFCGVLEDL